MTKADEILIDLERNGEVTFYKGTERIDIDIDCRGQYYTVSVDYVPLSQIFVTDSIVEFVRDMVGE